MDCSYLCAFFAKTDGVVMVIMYPCSETVLKLAIFGCLYITGSMSLENLASFFIPSIRA